MTQEISIFLALQPIAINHRVFSYKKITFCQNFPMPVIYAIANFVVISFPLCIPSPIINNK